MFSLKTFLKEERFYHYFQPIYNLVDGSIKGYEVLLRADEFSNPEPIFELAQKKKQLFELDTRSIYKGIKTYHEAGLTPKEVKLFINVFPSTLLNPKFLSFVKDIMNEHVELRQHLVMEIIESEVITNYTQLIGVIKKLKNVGVTIAIDDFGKGHHDMMRIIELEPHYIKLDRYFAHDLLASKKKQRLVKLIQKFCAENHCDLIIEGLEMDAEIAYVKSLGITYGQGFGLGMPQPIAKLKQTYEKSLGLQEYPMNKRKFRREKFYNQECTLRFLDFGTKKLNSLVNKAIQGYVEDISLGGSKVTLMLDLPVQNKVTVELSFEYNEEYYKIKGVIVRKEAHSSESMIGYGIQFLSLDGYELSRLNQLINTLELASLT
ncbi:EAL domain-containing protein (putative c-di-GMP-specific phosphodiesterase class I) [Pullulanibacillus pueri]|uniref:EAL domain-containing protein n=1 Tax=Pullulanibacillus pueri TaxID=1437324 RepID=A0A8J2ZWL6_9BACL|nr:EAL domain-containing protein [Pullulanibacillus pueri]MBM7680638.1 EAL domain-containing protein (putative c-di-GMP-specific phosphodiesterase class I) [Pullulanibacillus pueri]GGH83866.1 hypothetical protein GCM10007096_25620 [Pullulanibacillus pueri]